MSRIPLHLIAGSPGVGKTTVIRRYIARTPDYTAVLVNDFGETGYDASFIAEAGGTDKLRVENVPGGCLCCTSSAQMLPALKTLCEDPKIERIIIEPSGIAIPDPLLDMLHRAAEFPDLDLMPVMVLFDPASMRHALIRQIPFWHHLVDLAGIAVLNRCDLAPEEAVRELFECLQEWDPPKLRVVRTSHGDLPEELFSLRGPCAGPQKNHVRHTELPRSGTIRCSGVFHYAALSALLTRAASRLARFKGVFHTDQGWFRMEIAGHHMDIRPSDPFKMSSAEWIGEEKELAECITSCAVAPQKKEPRS